VEEVLRGRALDPQAAGVKVELSKLGEADWARGAALLVTPKRTGGLVFEQPFPAARLAWKNPY
jgi:hypothetical protein